MSWAIYCDGNLLYDPRLPEYALASAKLNQELNKADTLTFQLYPNHPAYGQIDRLRSTVEVRDGSSVVFRGRMLNDTVGWYNDKTITCEGALAWLNDSVQRPFSFPVVEGESSPEDYLRFLISRHNAQEPSDRQITVGTVTVIDPNNYIARSDTQYSSTWALVKEGLLNTLGGYLYLRYDSNGTYLDYLADFSVLANQPIEFGLNLLALKTIKKGEDICTAVLPLGYIPEGSEERLTISDLADETTSDICKDGDIVYSAAAESTYGARIVKTVIFDDVTLAQNLLTKAKATLAEVRLLPSTVNLTAADVSAAGYSVNRFAIGRYVNIVDDAHTAHDLLAQYLVTKISIDLLNPANNKLTLGATTYSLTESNRKQLADTAKVIEANVKESTTTIIREVETRNESAIMQSEQSLVTYVAQNTYTKGETDALVSAVRTEIEQTEDSWTISFSSLSQDLDDVAAGADAKFNSLYSYIQMQGGSITLGKTGNPVTLTIENDRIGIYVNGACVTYWTAEAFVSPGTLYVPVGGRLVLGNYAYIPRDNGSLDFVWVGS